MRDTGPVNNSLTSCISRHRVGVGNALNIGTRYELRGDWISFVKLISADVSSSGYSCPTGTLGL